MAIPVRWGGIAALVGALCWAIKGASILITGYQPPVIFEAAPALFAVALVSLAGSALARALGAGVAPSTRDRAVYALGVVAWIAGVVSAVTAFGEEVWGPAIAVASLSTLTGLVLYGVGGRGAIPPLPGALPALAIGIGSIPIIVVGGALSEVNERLLELSVLVLAGLWAWLGLVLLAPRVAEPASLPAAELS